MHLAILISLSLAFIDVPPTPQATIAAELQQPCGWFESKVYGRQCPRYHLPEVWRLLVPLEYEAPFWRYERLKFQRPRRA